jgi:hypothetical protein
MILAEWEPHAGCGRTVADLYLDEWVGQALGAASSCWENLAGAGEFDSTRCKGIFAALMAHLVEVIEAARAGSVRAAEGGPLVGSAEVGCESAPDGGVRGGV